MLNMSNMKMMFGIFVFGIAALMMCVTLETCRRPSWDPSSHNFDMYYETGGVDGSSENIDRNCHCYASEFANKSCDVKNEVVNCTSRGLQTVPPFTDPNIEVLILKCNLITTIQNNSFKLLFNLSKLDLSHNQILSMQPSSFSGLGKLRLLNLRCNNLSMSEDVFHKDIFSPLESLEWLKINRNNPNCLREDLSYPDTALSTLKNLQHLSVDGLKYKDFGPGFHNLTSLTTLITSGYDEGFCKMIGISNTTFQNVFRLRVLNISACFIDGTYIDANAFVMLTNLYLLNISHNEDINIQNLNKVFHSLRNITTLEILSMQLIVNRYSVGICLDSSYIQDFPQHLTHLYAQENNLEAVDAEVIALMPPSLEYLDVGMNKFVFGIYMRNVSRMTNLKTIVLSGKSQTYSLPFSYPYELHGSQLKSNCTIYDNVTEPISAQNIVFTLPPNLETLEMNRAGLSYTLSQLNVSENSLKNLSINNNYFPYLYGPFYGFDHLEYLDLSYSFVEYIHWMFFSELTSLLHLDLSSNLLGSFFSRKNSENVFSSLTNLNLLNLSFNAISELQPNMFQNLSNLSHLLLQKNNLQKFEVNVNNLLKLSKLNLKNTRISTLPKQTTDFFDEILKNNSKLIIDLAFAPISCSCSNLEFLEWMTTSKAFHPNFVNYTCVYTDSGISKDIRDNYTETIEVLRHQCSSHVGIFLVASGCSFVILCMVIGAVLYRFRWRLRYLYYAAYLNYSKMDRSCKSDYTYDAFVSYDQEDWRFVENKLVVELEKRDLKVCIHGRDFIAGDYIASNVVKAICDSRRTVVVLTRNMAKSYWCGYEIQMANMESVHTNRKVLLFVMMEDIPTSELSVDLLYNIRSNTYLPFNPDGDGGDGIVKFWDKLAHDIKH